MKDTLSFIDKNNNNFIEELKDYLRIPSISTLSANKKDMIECAKFVQKKLNSRDFFCFFFDMSLIKSQV